MSPRYRDPDDDDRAYDLLREDGWSNEDIRNRAYKDGGLYRGPKDAPYDLSREP